MAPEHDRRSLWVLGELVTCKVASGQTSGAYSLFEVTSPPGSGPPAHVQHRENEAFYVLEGEYEFLVEDSTVRVSPGYLVHVPKGTRHRHDNVGDIPARMLVIQTPGGLHQAFFEEIGEETSGRWESQVPERPESLARTREIAAGYGIEVLPTEKQNRQTCRRQNDGGRSLHE